MDPTHSMSVGWQHFESSPDCVKLLSQDGRVLAMNENGLCAMEIEDFSKFSGAAWKSFWPSASHDAIDAAIAAARVGGTGNFKAFCPTAKGAARWWDVLVTSIVNAPGESPSLLAISRDVTASHQAQVAMQASEARFRSLVMATSSIVWRCTLSGAFDTEQPAWSAFTGQSFEQYRDFGWLDAVHPEDRAATSAAWARAVEARAVYEFVHRLRGADGAYRHMAAKAAPVFDAAGAVVEWMGTHTDITGKMQATRERERLLRELQLAHERMKDIFDQAPAFMCVLNGPDHVFELVNERYVQLVGHRDPIGQAMRDALPELEGQGFLELLDRVYQTGHPFFGADMPVMLQRQPGLALEERFIDLVFMALRDADGHITGLLVHGVDQTARRLAELRQRTDRERILVATEAAELGLWRWERGSDTLVWENARPGDIFGLPPDSAPVDAAQFVQDFIHPDDAQGFIDAAAHTFETGARFLYQGRIRRTDGTERTVELFGRRQEGSGSAPMQLVGTISDITQRKQAEIALYQSRERFEKIVNQAATGVVEMDTAGRIIFANQYYADMLGYPLDALVGASVADVTAADCLPATLAAVRKLMDDGVGFVIDKEYRHRDGTAVPATSSVNALRGPDGRVEGLVAIVLDTTESKRAARELVASEERYRTLFEAMDQGFCIIDVLFDADGKPADYRFIEMNGMFEKHTGLRDAVGKTAKELVPDIDLFWIDTYGRVAQTGEAVRFESEVTAINRWFDVYATRIGPAAAGRVALLFSDISARKASDDTLRKLAADLSQADQRKTEFLATLAHELRNPLAPLRSGLGVLRLSGDTPAAVAKVREMMDRQVGHMVHLIDDLLDIARISGGKLELKKTRADLKAVMSSAVETSLPVIESGRHELIVDIPDASFEADVDVTRIAQVVANLLNNAAKYTPSGGRIRLAAVRDGSDALISVSDTGVGIPADAIASVFDMFSQVGRHLDRAQGGLGIGLSLVRRLVEMHGGEVTARSEGADRGSTFTVRLPLAQDAGGRAPQPDSGSGGLAIADASLDILVVDDNVDGAATLSMILEAYGHATRIAHDGLEAMAVLQAYRPDVVFLDIGMPGMNGYQTARAIRAMPGLERVRLVALTGWGTEKDRNLSSEAGFDHHLTKPVQLAVLQEVLEGLERAA